MKDKVEQIQGLCSKNSFDDETCTSVIKHLDRARELLSTTAQYPVLEKSNLEPSNKKIMKQQRYFSTKKRTLNHIPTRAKPSVTETASITDCLKEKQCVHIYTSANDHSYI